MRFTLAPILLASFALTLAAAPAAAGDKITIEQVPAAVRATIDREVGDGKITEIERETDDGKTEYEVEYTQAGKKWELKIDASGKLLKKEQDD